MIRGDVNIRHYCCQANIDTRLNLAGAADSSRKFHIYTVSVESACRSWRSTAEFMPFEVISTAILTYFYLLLGTNVRILVGVINARFQPDAPSRCIIVYR